VTSEPHRRARARLAAAGLLLALLGCTPMPAQPPEDLSALVWPPAPAPPRLAFLQSVTRAEDLGITRSLFGRIADLLFGATESRLVRPMAVVARGGVLYVADPGVRGVHRFEPSAGRYDVIRARGGAPLPSPVGLALGAGGEVLVSDSALGQVLAIGAGQLEAVPLKLEGGLRQPTGIAFDVAQQRLYVTDTAAHAVRIFRRDGSLEASIGRRGSADGEFNYPTYLWRMPDGRLLVTDTLNFRVQLLDANGAFMAKFGRLGDGSGDAARQKGIATDRYGHVYVLDAVFNALQVFGQDGRLLLSIGSLGRQRGEFWLPTGLFIDERDTLYIADSFNQRVQMLRYVGTDE
jgi:sugar lactone lactonase YvrE